MNHFDEEWGDGNPEPIEISPGVWELPSPASPQLTPAETEELKRLIARGERLQKDVYNYFQSVIEPEHANRSAWHAYEELSDCVALLQSELEERSPSETSATDMPQNPVPVEEDASPEEHVPVAVEFSREVVEIHGSIEALRENIQAHLQAPGVESESAELVSIWQWEHDRCYVPDQESAAVLEEFADMLADVIEFEQNT